MNKKTSLIVMTSLTATFVALCAAFFSVTGIAKLFAGATMSALIMASALELGKIVGISFLYQYWKEIPKILRAYLTTAAAALMIITSIGIYGFLSAAYQVTADKLAVMDQQTALLDLRKQRYQEELDLYILERNRLSSSIENLNAGLAGNIIQYVDQTTGQVITTTSSANRTALQEQLRSATEERSRLAERIETASDSITSLELQALDISMNNELAAEIGPLRFVSNLTGWEMDQVVNAFAIMIVLVFDPLAIALVISVNFLLKYKPEDEIEVVIEEKDNYDFLIKDNKEDEEPFKVYATEEEIIEEPVIIEEAEPEVEEPVNMEQVEETTEEKPLRKYEDVVSQPMVDWSLISQFFKYKYGGVPNWMHPNFDWDHNKYNWKNNPLAVQYKESVVDKQKK
jgi:hypothetical protein